MTDISKKSTDMITNHTDPSVFVGGRLIEDIRELIESTKSRFAQAANASLFILYWNVGKRINTKILGNERPGYGKEIVHALSRQLSWTHFREIPCMPKFSECSMNVPQSLKNLHNLPNKNLISIVIPHSSSAVRTIESQCNTSSLRYEIPNSRTVGSFIPYKKKNIRRMDHE
jgi:hypothetical protein